MELQVINKEGQGVGRNASLEASVFGIEPNTHAVYLSVKLYLANQRQGTHKSKERAEITGSTRKLKKQKGTGTARAGSIKSPVFRGGGRVFGPRPRNYGFKLNKKVKSLARKSALSAKAAESAITVVENFSFDKPATKSYSKFINDLSLAGKKSLFVLGEADKNVYLSSRGVSKAKVVTVNELCTYDIINADVLLLDEKALEQISKF